MLKRIKVRGKLLLLLATPLIAVLVFAFSGIADRSDSASFQERETRIAELADAGSDLSLAIQVERLRTIQGAQLTADVGEALAPERAETDEQLTRWLLAVGRARADIDGDEELLAAIDFMSDRLPANLTDDRTSESEVAALTSFLALASRSIDEITAGLVDHAADLDLFKALSDHNRLQAVQSAYVDVTSVGADALTTGELPIVSATLLEAADRRITSNTEAFNETADPEQVAALRELQSNGVLPSPASANSHPVEEIRSYLDDPSRGFIDWIVQGEERLIALNGLIDDLLADAAFAAASEAQGANDEAQSFLVLAGSVALLAVVMALLVGRSISRPLIRLTRNAEQLSTEELPALVDSMKSAGRTEAPVLTPIEVNGRDEVAQLAHAISEIQQVTIDVAEEQGDLLRRGISDIFVNLARRNQSLLDRQIDFIDQLESREESPDQLENLFRLDHLATRMRRNAESLLVLAGAEPTRRRGRPVEIVDVMRVAMGEIEDYGRIELHAVDSATVAGSVAVDLAHLLSELMENATQFSPPEFMVGIDGSLDISGAYRLTLSDKGIGMSAEQINTANQTLAEPPIVGLDLSRSLGFTVVSRLAHRLGISVVLSAGADGGVTATILIPAEMIGSVDHTVDEAPPVIDDALPVVDEAPPVVDEALPVIDGPPAQPSAFEPPAVVAAAPPAPIIGVDDGAAPFDTPTPTEPGALPQRRPATPVAATQESEGPDTADPVPASAPATPPPGGDLFAAFGSAVETPPEPDDAERDLFAPLDRASEQPTEDPPPPLPSRKPAAHPEPTAPGSSLPPPVPQPEPATPPPLPTRASSGAADGGPQVTRAGLVRRTPRQVDVPEESKYAPGGAPVAAGPTATETAPAAPNRSPEEVRQMLSRYRAGLRKGRGPDSDDPTQKRQS